MDTDLIEDIEETDLVNLDEAAEISSDEEFMAYTKKVLKNAHSDEYDDKKAEKTAKGILAKADGDYTAAVGMLTSGLGESTVVEENVEETTSLVNTEDLDKLIESSDLPEEFKATATVIFESSVNAAVKTIKENLETEYEAKLVEEAAQIQETLSLQIDSYLTYAIENWLEENRVAIESGVRTQLAEEFISSLKGVFTEHYIDIPESKVDVVSMLEKENAKLKEDVEITKNTCDALQEQNETLAKEKILNEASANLADTQVDKLKDLTEGLVFVDEKQFTAKVEKIKELYFKENTSEKKENTDSNLYESTEIIEENAAPVEHSPRIQNYLSALGRMARAQTTTNQ